MTYAAGSQYTETSLNNLLSETKPIMGLTSLQHTIMSSAKIQKDIADGRLTAEEAMGLTSDQYRSLTSVKIRQDIVNERLTFEQAMGLTSDQYSKLTLAIVQLLIDNNIITVSNALAFTWEQCHELDKLEILARLFNGTLTLADFMAGRHHQVHHGEPVNCIQSTHTASVHPMVTPKLGIIIREEAINYIAALSSPSNSNQAIGITDLLTRVSKEGAAAIWDKIRPNVTARMFSEFGSLYKNDLNNPEFVALIDTGKNLKLENLPSFQEAVAKSPGYREWCSNLLNKNGFFASSGAAKKTGQEIVKWQEAPVNSTI
jgi:hypothetical protein